MLPYHCRSLSYLLAASIKKDNYQLTIYFASKGWTMSLPSNDRHIRMRPKGTTYSYTLRKNAFFEWPHQLTFYLTYTVLWHSICHSTWHIIILAFYLTYIWTFYLSCILTFYLTYILTFYVAFYLACILAFYFDYILFGICSDILSGILFDISSGIQSGILSGSYSDFLPGLCSGPCVPSCIQSSR